MIMWYWWPTQCSTRSFTKWHWNILKVILMFTSRLTHLMRTTVSVLEMHSDDATKLWSMWITCYTNISEVATFTVTYLPLFMGSQRVGHDWATELNWMTDLPLKTVYLYGSSINIILSGEKLKAFYLRSGTRKGHLATLGSLLKRVSHLKQSVWQDTTLHSYEN